MMFKGYSLFFKGNHCLVFDFEDNLIVKVEMVDKAFPLDGKFDSANFASKDESWLWHKRYGHFNYATLKYMYEKGLTKDLTKISLSKEVCESCQMGKVHRKAFPKNATWRATEKLELVHTDVCGPMQTSSLGHSKYFVFFIDDLTRMTWVYFLKNKSQVFSVFKKFKVFVERQSGCKLKALRSDNGGEYISNEFNKYCEDIGVDHKLTVSYSPENKMSLREEEQDSC